MNDIFYFNRLRFTVIGSRLKNQKNWNQYPTPKYFNSCNYSYSQAKLVRLKAEGSEKHDHCTLAEHVILVSNMALTCAFF